MHRVGITRRLSQFLGKRANSRSHEKDERTRKKPRLTESSKGPLDTPIQPQTSEAPGTTILSLPDEALDHIFIHLGACKTDGSFARPRYAFQLAQTNTRLLRLFSSLLTRINPFIEDTIPGVQPDYTTPTLSSHHLLSAARIAGETLQELHLPRTSFKHLPTICNVCPRLKVLSVVNDPEVTTNVLASAVHLSLHSLSITEPSRNHLESLVPTPSELSLIKMKNQDINGLESILRNPPKRFNLRICDGNKRIPQSMVATLLQYLEVAVPKMESVSVSVFCASEIEPRHFPDKAVDFIDAARNSNEQSTCMSLSLEGSVLFGLVTRANRNAKIELTRRRVTFRGDADGIHVLAIDPGYRYLPCDHYLTAGCDFSRLGELSICHPLNPEWKQIFSGAKLKKAFIRTPRDVANMSLSFETLEMPLSHLMGKKWSWLGDARHIRFLTSTQVRVRTILPLDSRTARIAIFESLVSLLKQFRGDTVWIDSLDLDRLKPERYGYHFAQAVKGVRAAAESFEARGGDAGTVKTLAAEIMTRWRR